MSYLLKWYPLFHKLQNTIIFSDILVHLIWPTRKLHIFQKHLLHWGRSGSTMSPCWLCLLVSCIQRDDYHNHQSNIGWLRWHTEYLILTQRLTKTKSCMRKKYVLAKKEVLILSLYRWKSIQLMSNWCCHPHILRKIFTSQFLAAESHIIRKQNYCSFPLDKQRMD